MDSYFIRLTGKVNVPDMVSIGHNYELKVSGSVTDESKEDNEDGTFSYVSTFRPITGEISKDHGKAVKLRDTRKYSAKVRAVLYRLWEASEDPRSAEEAYEAAMRQILTDISDTYEKSRKG